LSVKKNKPGQNRWTTEADVVEFVQVLARHMPDSSIASILNRSGKSTGRGNSWTSSRVYQLRHSRAIEPYREGERAERGEVSIEEAASALSISPSTILRMLNDGSLPAKQLCKGAPWIIRKEDLERKNVCARKRNIDAGADGVRRLKIAISKPSVFKEFYIMRSKSLTS
jgi:excisionase family DNA binding protein